MNHPQYETTRHLFDWHNRVGALVVAAALFCFLLYCGAQL